MNKCKKNQGVDGHVRENVAGRYEMRSSGDVRLMGSGMNPMGQLLIIKK